MNRVPDDCAENLPPSSKLVYMVLSEDDEMSRNEICEQTGLPESTTRYALGRLVDEDIVEVGIDDSDGRRLVYTADL